MAYKPDFTNWYVAQKYLALFDSMGKLNKEAGLNISFSDYALDGHAIFTFDITQDRSGNEYHLNLICKGTIGIEIGFFVPLVEAVTLLVVAETQSIIQVDRYRNILVEYYVFIMSALDSAQINYLLSRDPIATRAFLGVFPINKLPRG